MTDSEKINRIKLILGNDAPSDSLLTEYLTMAKDEILNWLYSNITRPDTVSAVPQKYEQVQIMAVVEALNIRGAEGQTKHDELDVNRTFKYADMVSYIHANVFPYLGIEGYENT